MPDSVEICHEVADHLPEIMDDWQELAEERPWLALPHDVGVDHLPEVVEALVEAATREPGDDGPDPRCAVVRYALKHGEDRRRQGYEDHSLFQEFHLLREAIWAGMRRRHPREPATFTAIGLLDTAITAATRASLHGFHRQDSRGDELVNRLVRECSWPGDS